MDPNQLPHSIPHPTNMRSLTSLPPPTRRSPVDDSLPFGPPRPIQARNDIMQHPPSQRAASSLPPNSLNANGDEQSMVQKCVRFFRTLIQLSQTPEQDPNRHHTHAKVKELVSNVMFGRMPAEEFTARLQDALRSQAQPHLLPFLQRTLPYLRNALSSGEVVIEGISPPPHAFPPPAPPERPGSPSISAPVVEEDVSTRVLNETPIKNTIIRPVEIMKKITRRINTVCYVDEDVLTLISDAAEYRLRKVMSELTSLTEHRLYLLKSHPHYEVVDDVRKQVRFLEDIDRELEERKEARDKEALIRMSKNKKTGKETVERAKEMQKADAELARNRDANAAAIAALGSSRSNKRKWDTPSNTTASNQSGRQRTLRVSMRDMQSLLSRHCQSKVATKIAYALSMAEGQL